MNEVYVVTERLYKRAYFAEPYHSENIVKVYGDYHSAVVGIRDLILEDHAALDSSGKDLTHYSKCDPNCNEFDQDSVIFSYTYSNDNQYTSKSYRLKSYNVE